MNLGQRKRSCQTNIITPKLVPKTGLFCQTIEKSSCSEVNLAEGVAIMVASILH